MSKKGVGYNATNGSSIRNYGEKRLIEYTESGGIIVRTLSHREDQLTRWTWAIGSKWWPRRFLRFALTSRRDTRKSAKRKTSSR